MSVAVRVTIDGGWKTWSKGSVIPEMPEGVAGDLVRRELVEYVTQDMRSLLTPVPRGTRRYVAAQTG